MPKQSDAPARAPLERKPLERIASIPPGLTWHVVRTNPRCEERALRGLMAAGYLAYLPRGSKLMRRRHMRSKQRIPFALLTGYAFVGLPTHGDYLTLHGIDGVAGILGRRIDDGSEGLRTRYVPVRDTIVREFHRLETAGTFDEIDPEERPFAKGDSVTVKEGPLKGLEFHFDDYFGKRTAVVIRNLFGSVIPVKIDLANLQRAA